MKSEYNVSEAARQLGVTRATIYRHINRTPGRYTIQAENGVKISVHGLGLLRDDIRSTSNLDTKNTESIQIKSVDEVLYKAAIEDVSKMSNTVLELQAETALLKTKLEAANEVVGALRAQITTLERALAFAQSQVPKRLPGHVGSLWERLFKRDRRVEANIQAGQ